ncbi:hypothetical protein HJG60_011085 [Phyllostomus discolor]|uniref:Uncharacterized protein n=1 Tax=Phyllostomus discolor TaxID=89673 RepID=A0A834E4Z5_9CHIR|nr:hypothetical protein HJG60_011085 [Phyllostomus discolor]
MIAESERAVPGPAGWNAAWQSSAHEGAFVSWHRPCAPDLIFKDAERRLCARAPGDGAVGSAVTAEAGGGCGPTCWAQGGKQLSPQRPGQAQALLGAPLTPPSVSPDLRDGSLRWGSVSSPPRVPRPPEGGTCGVLVLGPPLPAGRPPGDTHRHPHISARSPRAVATLLPTATSSRSRGAQLSTGHGGSPSRGRPQREDPAGAPPATPFEAPPSRQDGVRETTLRLFPAQHFLFRAGERTLGSGGLVSDGFLCGGSRRPAALDASPCSRGVGEGGGLPRQHPLPVQAAPPWGVLTPVGRG